MSDLTVRYDEIQATDWQPKLGELGAIVEALDDIDQCIRIILTTPRGSVPHQPDFGSDLWRYVDWPLQAALPHIVRETVDQVARWEPRVEVTGVTVEEGATPGELVVRIERRLRVLGGGTEATTVVRVA